MHGLNNVVQNSCSLDVFNVVMFATSTETFKIP